MLVNMSLRTIMASVFWSVALISAGFPAISQQSANAVAGTGVSAILPNGRQIRPAGNWIPLAPYPFAIALKPDGSQAAIPSIGFPFALNVVEHPDSDAPSVRRLPSGENNDPAIETHAGLAYSGDGKTLYVATGNSGKIALYSTDDWSQIAQIPLDGKVREDDFAGSFAASLLISADGRTLYALDQGNWRVVVIDAVQRQVIASIPTGAYPFGLALSPDGDRLYVTNTGLFEYSMIPGAKREDELGTGLKFPPFGYPSKEAREGVTIDGRKIAGLGDENSDRGSSLWTYDVHDSRHPVLTARLRLGDRITDVRNGDVGGSAPTGVAADADAVYVSLAHQDSIAKISPDGSKVLAETPLSPFTGKKFADAQGRPLRGVMPSGLAIGGGKLYVAESGIDAVAVLDAVSMQVLEHIPAGWNPSAVTLSSDGKTLYIVNTKGKGAGPNAGRLHAEDSPTYVGALEYGSLTAVNLASLPDAQSLTNDVLANNTYAIENRPTLPHLKHCFLVIRENRTYDEVLGDIMNANGDPTLARYGLDGWAEERHQTKIEAAHLKVTPNLHAIARHYAMSDNFYVDSDVSADGHRWVVGINPTPFFNTAWSSGYGGRRSGDSGAPQPGRRALFGGADAPMPEDEPQFGSLWEHIADSGLGILNYGEGLEVEGNDELDGGAPEGQRLFLNAPVPKPIFESSDRRFPTFNLGIPDQFRVEEFKRDFSRRLAQHKIPGLIVIRLPNDHTADPRPADGYPYRASYVADNDLALGRIVDFLSKTSIWKDSALFVTEDDAQGGVDHVDAHRSILGIASPWVTAGAVSHEHSSMGSITRTIDELLGVGALNLEDALAGEFIGVFASTPHLEPFTFQPSDTRVFDPAKARLAKPKTKVEAAALRDMDDAPEIQKQMEKSRGSLRKPGTD
jgi:YVTN family beta-propeller protein